MTLIEQENQRLREEVTTLKRDIKGMDFVRKNTKKYNFMHHFAFIVSSLSLTLSLSNKRSIRQSTRTYNTRTNQKKRMDLIEQENQRLREEVTTLKGDLERLTAMVTTLMAAHNHPTVPLPTSTSLAQSNTSAIPISIVEGYL